MRSTELLALACLVVLSACAAERDRLVPKSAAVPVGVDLSGQWQLHEDSADTADLISEAEQARRNERRSQSTLVRIFLETGESLRVTQTSDGIFISFDRAVVEEYRFGEHRDVNVGPVEAERVSGWEGSAYVIETLDSDGAKLIETYRLGDGGRELLRTIRIEQDDTIYLDSAQAFDRG